MNVARRRVSQQALKQSTSNRQYPVFHLSYFMAMADIDILVAMGFGAEQSQVALQAANGNVEAAIQMLVADDKSGSGSEVEIELKMICVVRTDLKMSSGKIAAQCVHAALGATRKVERLNPNLLSVWVNSGEKVVCLQVDSRHTLEELHQTALAATLPTYIVYDAGRTEVEAGSATVLSIGPASVDLINAITGHLKLLK